MPRARHALAVLLTAPLLWGCQSPSRAPEPAATSSRTPASAEQPTRIPLLIGANAVSWSELQPSLAEGAGRQAIEELILDREISRRLEARGLTITAEMLQTERARLDAGAGGTPEALAEIRRTRGLGPERLSALLRRNAGLRALVGTPAEPTPTELRHAFELRYGPRRVLRVMVIPDVARAGKVRESLKAVSDPEQLEWAFARAAFEESTDPSAAAGGLIGAVHPLDAALPEAVRNAVLETADGKLSSLVLNPTGAVLVLPVRTTEASGVTFEDVQGELAADLSRQKQRLAMDELARSILAEARPTVLDPSLNWAWENARSGR